MHAWAWILLCAKPKPLGLTRLEAELIGAAQYLGYADVVGA
jgi:hypothetical protein